jgi:trehalose transport system permease protein
MVGDLSDDREPRDNTVISPGSAPRRTREPGNAAPASRAVVKTTRWLRKHRLEAALATPLFGYVLLLTVAPILDTLRLSLTAPSEGGALSLVNYGTILEAETFRRAVANTVVVALLSIGLQLGLGLAVALTLHARFPLRALVRTIMFVPLGVPTIVSGAVMLLIFSRSGYLNSALFGLADVVNLVPGMDWQFVPSAWTVAGGWRTLATVAVADLWKVLPVVTLVLLAGLESIPDEVYEAADVDGATRWQRFTRVTLPLLLPYVTTAVILRAIDAFRIFELALVLAGRVEPVLGTYVWSRYGPPANDPHTAAAASIVLFGIILLFIALHLRFVAAGREVER